VNDLAFVGSPLPTTWTAGHISDVTSKVGSGATPRGGAAVYVQSGASFIRSQNVHDHEFRPEGLVHIADNVAHQLRGVTVEAGDVLLNITGDSILRTCVVPEAVLPARVSQHVAIVRSNGRVDPGFMQKWLSLPAMKDFMLGRSSGGTRKAITRGHILSFPIPVPPIAEQKEIAATLGALDDKIESNRRAIDLAEALGDSLFAETDYDRRALSEVASLTMGSSPPGTSYNEDRVGLPFYQGVRDFGRRYPGLRVWTDAPVRIAQPNDTLVSVRAPVGNLNRAVEVCCIGRGVAAVNSPWPSTIYYALRAASSVWEPFQQEGTVFGAINRTDLSAARLPWPEPSRLQPLEERLAAIDARIQSLTSEIDRLAQLRDVLLPELLSGRIRVPEAAEGIEVAA
jgi:type I restriction enzyme S subunit